MTGIIIGALLIIIGVVWAGLSTAQRGSLSDTPPPTPESAPTLEPRGRGRRIGLKANLPALLLVGLGVVILAAGALAQSG